MNYLDEQRIDSEEQSVGNKDADSGTQPHFQNYWRSLIQTIFKKLLETALMSTYFFYKENLPHKSRFSNCKILHQKQKLISVWKVLLHLSFLELS